MPQSLFDSVNRLYQKLDRENLDIHSTQQELAAIVAMGRDNNKLRILTQFTVILESLARNYEYDEAFVITEVKIIIKNSLSLIIQMVEGSVSNVDGAYQIEHFIRESKELLIKKLGITPFLFDENLILQLAYDLEKDGIVIANLCKKTILVNNTKQYYETLNYYLKKIRESISFVGIKPLEELLYDLSSFVDKQYQDHQFAELFSYADFLLVLEYLQKTALFLQNNYRDKQAIIEYLKDHTTNHLQKRLQKSSLASQREINNNFQQSMILSNEEIAVLMSDDYSLEIVSFDDVSAPEPLKIHQDQEISVPKSIPSVTIQQEEYQNLVKNSLKVKSSETAQIFESDLIHSIGRLFHKQELLINQLSEEKQVEFSDDLAEIHTLTSNIKKSLFDTYYMSVEKLLGKELRDFIHHEVKELGKKIRLGIRGEHSELLVQDSEFIKDLVFHLVKNSLHYSLEPVFRRRATDKNETAWLLIEFEDAADTFDIYIRDDGRGLVVDQMQIHEIEDQIMNRGGTISIDAMDNEYLKIHVQLPMKRVFINCLAVQIGNITVLIPNRCIHKVVNLKESVLFQKDQSCLGQVNFSTLLGLDHTTVSIFIICEFGIHKILFGVDSILYKIEAIVEDIDMTLIPGIDRVSILKDGSIGFIINEKMIYQMAKDLILKRNK
ncbi:MAG: hypothetical protein ACRCWI_01180 [Brevinema sp.]